MSNVLVIAAEGHSASKPHNRERRKRERVRVPLPVHVQLLDQSMGEMAKTLDINRYGLRFISFRDHYHRGIPLFLTLELPYCAGSARCLGEVVRVGALPNGSRAVVVRFAEHCTAELQEWLNGINGNNA